jgi:DNA mismatch repair protein MutL
VQTAVEIKEEPAAPSTPDAPAEPTERAETLEYRIVGEVFNAYVVVERGESMLLIDKHAAHERIIFEELKAAMRSSAPTSQMLMLPIEVMMTSDEIQTLDTYREEIEAIGFEFTEGRYSVSVLAIPEGVSTDAVSDMLVVMAERIKSGTGTAGLTRDIVFEKALYQASCKAAIKAGREYVGEHIKWIVDKLMALPDITVCPHGRPVAMELTKKNLDRQFDRT